MRDVTKRARDVSARTAVVGEDRDIAEILHDLTGGASVLVVGTLGSGKSFLLDAVTHTLSADGRPPLVARAASSLTGTPLAALRKNASLAGLLDGDAPRSPAHPSPPVIVVDDGHLLDVESARWLAQAVHVGRVVALVVAAPSSSAEARRAHPETLIALDELWISGHARRVDLRPLTFAEAEELIETEAPHGLVDRVRRADLYRASGGSRLFLVEMLRSLAEDGSAAFSGIRITDRIRDVLRYQLSTLSHGQRVCLALVSRLGGVTRPRLSRVVEARSIDRLLERGHLVVDAHRPDMLHASTIFSTLHDGFADTEDVDDLVDALGDILPSEVVLSGEEAADIAMRWSFDGRLPRAVERHGVETVHPIVLMASAEALEKGRFRDALMLAQMAESIGPSADARVAASRALAGLRRDEEALELLETAVVLLSGDAEALRLFQWWGALLIGLRRFDALPALSDTAKGWPAAGPLVIGEIRAAQIQADYAFMRWDEVARSGWDLLQDRNCALATRVRAGVEAASALAYRGDVDAAFRCLEATRRVNTDPVTGFAIDEVAHVTVLTGEAILRVALGRSVRDLLGEVETILRRPGSRPAATTLGFLAYAGAVADLFRGDLEAADLEYRSAVSRLTSAESSGWRSGIHCEHALVLLLLGDTVAAAEALRQAEALGAARTPLTRHLLMRAQYVNAVRTGEAPESFERELLDLGAGSPTLHALDLYLVLVHGRGGPDDRTALDRLTDESDDPFARLFAAHIAARDAGDAKLLEAVAAGFAALGIYLFALRAQEDAVDALGAIGNALRLSQAKRQLAAYRASSRRADTTTSTATLLSERERQVATLIGEGLSNRQIADHLFLSVRTVESHIYQARLKLGAPSRRGLAEALEILA
jgi:DNA-binding NarL/FixJ family response regulator